MCEVAYSELRGLPTISDRLFGVPIIRIKCLGALRWGHHLWKPWLITTLVKGAQKVGRDVWFLGCEAHSWL